MSTNVPSIIVVVFAYFLLVALEFSNKQILEVERLVFHLPVSSFLLLIGEMQREECWKDNKGKERGENAQGTAEVKQGFENMTKI